MEKIPQGNSASRENKTVSVESDPLSILKDPEKRAQALRVLGDIERALQSLPESDSRDWGRFFCWFGFQRYL